MIKDLEFATDSDGLQRAAEFVSAFIDSDTLGLLRYLTLSLSDHWRVEYYAYRFHDLLMELSRLKGKLVGLESLRIQGVFDYNGLCSFNNDVGGLIASTFTHVVSLHLDVNCDKSAPLICLICCFPQLRALHLRVSGKRSSETPDLPALPSTLASLHLINQRHPNSRPPKGQGFDSWFSTQPSRPLKLLSFMDIDPCFEPSFGGVGRETQTLHFEFDFYYVGDQYRPVPHDLAPLTSLERVIVTCHNVKSVTRTPNAMTFLLHTLQTVSSTHFHTVIFVILDHGFAPAAHERWNEIDEFLKGKELKVEVIIPYDDFTESSREQARKMLPQSDCENQLHILRAPSLPVHNGLVTGVCQSEEVREREL
ncbi:hypothetical protein PQX77_003063 [Marasmius sp. AFHP31]|nr:hypothetical protein PQX77_003063 [Marasmius sp. AFHP31]